MSARLVWYQWFTADWLVQTRGWPLVADGAARRLLDAQWDQGALPREPEALRTLIQATPAEWRVAWPLVKGLFPVVGAHRLNADLEKKRADAHALVARRQRAGQAGNRARWGTSGQKVVPLKRDQRDDA